MCKKTRVLKKPSWWREGFISQYFLYIFYLTVSLLSLQISLMTKQLKILADLKAYLPIQKIQLTIFNYVNNHLSELTSGNYQIQDINVQLQFYDDKLLVNVLNANSFTYEFTLENEQIVDYQIIF